MIYFFFLLLGRSLRNSTVIHLHGGNIDRYLNSAKSYIKHLNRQMLADIRYGIVLSEYFKNIYDGYISRDKVRVVNNCFEPFLLISREKISKKFIAPEKIRIVFLSNLIKEKGHDLLLSAFLSLTEKSRNKALLSFAGEAPSLSAKLQIIKDIRKFPNINYMGPIHGETKRELLQNAHIFVLPSYFRYEGQPISIIEAYACGCIVVASNNGGIADILRDGINGFLFKLPDKKILHTSVTELREVLEKLIVDIGKYRYMAYNNYQAARSIYNQEYYIQNIEQLIYTCADDA